MIFNPSIRTHSVTKYVYASSASSLQIPEIQVWRLKYHSFWDILMIRPKDLLTHFIPMHLSDWLLQSSLGCFFNGKAIVKGAILPTHMALYCIQRTLMSISSFKIYRKPMPCAEKEILFPNEGAGSESEVKCFIQDHMPRKWQNWDSLPGFLLPSSLTTHSPEGLFDNLREEGSSVWLGTLGKFPRGGRIGVIRRMDRFWLADPKERKDPGGRMVWARGDDKKVWGTTIKQRTVAGDV